MASNDGGSTAEGDSGPVGVTSEQVAELSGRIDAASRALSEIVADADALRHQVAEDQ